MHNLIIKLVFYAGIVTLRLNNDKHNPNISLIPKLSKNIFTIQGEAVTNSPFYLKGFGN